MTTNNDFVVKTRVTLVLAAAMAFPAFAYAGVAAPKANRGYDVAVKGVRKGIPACASCHGSDGQGRLGVGIPRLAGLSAFYIDSQLRYFADGKRVNDIMTPYAKTLTPAERRAVAGYFSAKPAKRPMAGTGRLLKPTEATEFKLGQEIAENGIWHREMPACGLCHGATGAGVGAEFPALAGQSRGYLIGQLDAWKANGRHTPLGKFMRAETLHMNHAEIKAVATYYALLSDNPKYGGGSK